MKPSAWPHHLDDVFAKSAEKGGETLTEHTWDVLEKLATLYQLRPNLSLLVEQPRLWHCLFWTCLLHDFGKAARGFQFMLEGKGRWNHRHEVLSLACFDWIASDFSEQERLWVVGAIVSHHRDAKTIAELYASTDPDPLEPLLSELSPDVTKRLWQWIDGYATAWSTALGFAPSDVTPIVPMPRDVALTHVLENGVKRVRFWLRKYDRWVEALEDPLPMNEIIIPILLRGLTTSADHMASAHLREVPPPIQESWQSLAQRVLKPGRTPYTHQELSAAQTAKSTILIAPTGSGKTEAALFWALGDGSKPVTRLFYALPYQASMNAMFERLKDPKKGFGEQAVGLQHGRAIQAMYVRMVNQEMGPKQAAVRAAWEKNINMLNARPVKVFSPYQMLKAMFQIRGFEAMLTDYTQAAFIFDEIHAYQPDRAAMILNLIKYLREHFNARFFIMSATFPSILRKKLLTALGPHRPIFADANVFNTFRRHRLHLLDGDLLTEGIGRIVNDVKRGNSVLVCANTVARAQAIEVALRKAGLTKQQILLIHSRYTIGDRMGREEKITELCGIDVPSQPFVLIATQVVEVSLNIDLDTIYTDPAPLEALLQRFGRVNRACKKGIRPVHVFRQPDDGQYVYGYHADPEKRGRIVKVTLEELERHDGQEIDESEINTWLDRIYDDPFLHEQWEEDYQRSLTNSEFILSALRPFNSDSQQEREFEQMFDTIDVLPKCFERQYVDCLSRSEFIEASKYFVSISTRKYAELSRKGLVLPVEDPEAKQRKWVVNLPYDDEQGLLFQPSDKDPHWD
jgi:CRISPR-associated endonuclease/helicase Cas3